jgi:hypothetical protein
VADPRANRSPIPSSETIPFSNMFHRVACQAAAYRNCLSTCNNAHRDNPTFKSICHNACAEEYGC